MKIIIYFTIILLALNSLLPCTTAQDEDATKIRTKRIAEGTLARRGQFPYACHIAWYWAHPSRRDPKAGYPAGSKPSRGGITPYQESLNSKLYQCSCAIIHKYYVVTAAHCFQPAIDYYNKTDEYTLEMNSTNWPMYVRAGFVDGKIQEPGLQERNGVIVLAHLSYENQSTLYDADVAIVRLNYAFDVDDSLAKVRVASIGKTFGPHNHLNIYCMGLGYGKEVYIPPSPTATTTPSSVNLSPKIIDRLNYFKVKVGPARYCRYLQRKLNVHSMYFDQFFLCAVTNNDTFKQHTCVGDIGGPLVCGGVLMGVLSQRREHSPCDLVGNSFSMYTYLGSKAVLDWLNMYIPDLSAVLSVPFDVPWAPEPPFGPDAF